MQELEESTLYVVKDILINDQALLYTFVSVSIRTESYAYQI